MKAALISGIAIGSIAGYCAGRVHKAFLGWREDVEKLRRDRKSVRKGPHW